MSLDHPTTLANFRTATWYPELFEHTTMRQWEDKGRSDIVGEARQIAKKRIAEHDYLLDADKRRDLEAIYERAKKGTE